MARSKSTNKPTEAELSLLNVLWSIGPATVREIHDAVSSTQKLVILRYLKILRIMHEKSVSYS